MSTNSGATALDAEERIPVVSQERQDLILRCYLVGHGPLSSGERRQLADLADELSRLHGEVADYYRQAADRDYEEAGR